MNTRAIILIYFISLTLFHIGQANPPTDTVYNFYSTTEAAHLLSHYIQFESLSGKEKQAGEFIKSICIKKGLFITPMGDQNGSYNFAASIYPLDAQKPNIVFLNHIDVVAAKTPEEWRYPPFDGTIAHGNVWGRGAYDNKGNAIMQLLAISSFIENQCYQDLPYNLTFLAVSGEEIQAPGGARKVAEEYLDELNPVVVIGEGPPGIYDVMPDKINRPIFGISIAHKRGIWLKLTLKVDGQGHSSVTPKSYAAKNFIEAIEPLLRKKAKLHFNDINLQMLKDLGKLMNGIESFILQRPKTFKFLITPFIRKDPALVALFSNNITITHITSDAQSPNMLAQEISCHLDCRLLPETKTEEFIGKLKKQLKGSGITIEQLTDYPTQKPSSIHTPFYEAIESAILQHFADQQATVMPMLLPNTLDSGWFRSKGVLAYSFVPILVNRDYLDCIHNKNERISIGGMEKGIAIYKTFLEEILKTQAYEDIIAKQ